MWASSRTGLRGFRVSLARTATKEDCIEVQFSASEVIPCYRRAKHGTTSPPPPPARKGGLPPYVDYTGMCRWTGYGFWSLSGMVSTIDIPFRFSVLNMFRVSNPPRHPCTQTFIKSPPFYSPPREWCYSAEPRLRDAECHEVSEAKLTEHSHSRTKCNNIICSGC